jgi:hypothetical protein
MVFEPRLSPLDIAAHVLGFSRESGVKKIRGSEAKEGVYREAAEEQAYKVGDFLFWFQRSRDIRKVEAIER